MTMSGSSEDIRHAQKLKKQISSGFIWFEHDEKSYIIRDQATIARARKVWEPQEELGKKQEELGRKMEQVQVKVPDRTAELDCQAAKTRPRRNFSKMTVERCDTHSCNPCKGLDPNALSIIRVNPSNRIADLQCVAIGCAKLSNRRSLRWPTSNTAACRNYVILRQSLIDKSQSK